MTTEPIAQAPAAESAAATEMTADSPAPPTIDSHGGKLNPVTCFGCGPDGVTSMLMMLALLSTLAPRRLKALGRTFDLEAARLAPGLLLTAALALNLLPSLEPPLDLPQRFHLVGPITAALGGVLLTISFLRLLSDALMPVGGRSRARSLSAMVAAGIAVLAFPPAMGLNVYALMDDGSLRFDAVRVLGGYLGLPAGLAILLAWRRFAGWVFNTLLVIGTVALPIFSGLLFSGEATSVMVFMAVALTVAASIGAGLRGTGAAEWQGLTGRAAWILGWILSILLIMAVGSWTIF